MIWSLLVAGSALAAPAAPVLDVWVRPRDQEDHHTLRSLGLGFVESVDNGWWRFHGEPSVEPLLKTSGIDYRRASVRKTTTKTEDAHRSPSEMVSAIEELAYDNPDSVEIVDLGTSVEGRPIVGLRLTRSASPRTRMRILGAHHGDETSSAEVTLDAAKRLIEDPSLSALLDEAEIWVVPHVNPDGIAMLQRYNANSVDLNRNYGFEWSSSSFRPGDGPFSEPETRAIRALGAWNAFGLGLSVHSGAVNLGWVWNYTTEITPDEELLSSLADVYAEDCTTEGFWTTNGAEWYITNGDTTDWSYGRYGTLDYTLEVSVNKHPDGSQMALVIDEHADAIPAVMSWPWWASGRITDAATGLPVQGTVTLVDDGQHIVAGPDGHFSRPVSEAVWGVEVSAPGYASSVMSLEPWAPAIEIALEPTALSPITPEDRWLGTDGMFTLDGEADTVTLFRPGHANVTAEPTGSSWRVTPSKLSPGPWSLLIDGLPRLNAVFVPETDEYASIASVSYTGDDIEIDVPGLGRGARVWRLDGSHRNFNRVEVEEDLEREVLVLPASAMVDSSTDFVIWTRGMQLVLAGLGAAEPEDEPDILDTGDPDGDEPELPDSWEEPVDVPDGVDDGGELKAGGCQVAPQDYPHLIWLVSLIGLISRRRSQCAFQNCSSPSSSD